MMTHIPDGDPDLDIVFMPISNQIEFVRCSKRQRETLELIMREKKITYRELVNECEKVSGKAIRGIGELSRTDASWCIKKIGGMIRYGIK